MQTIEIFKSKYQVHLQINTSAYLKADYSTDF